MRPKSCKIALGAMLSLSLVLLTACASAPQPLPPPVVVAPPSIPPLPPEARQPPTPGLCSLTCSQGLSSLLGSLLSSPTSVVAPELPASGPTPR